MKPQQNPFRYGAIVQGDHYCQRGQEHAVMQYLAGGNNVYVQGRRRTGKSSLVQESIRRSGLKSVACHLGMVSGVEDVVKAIGKALAHNKGWLGRAVDQVAALRPVMTFPSNMDGSWGVSLASGGNSSSDLISLFEALEKVAPKKGMVVYLDEFQQILKIEDADKILWEIRNIIQHHERCRYLFAGSVTTLMDSMFLDSAKPFYNSAIAFQVGPIEPDRYWEFVAEKLRSTGREIDKEAFDYAYRITDGVVGDLQEIFSEVWNQSVSFVSRSSIEDVVKVCVERKKGLFMALCSRYSDQQMRVLRAAASLGAEKPTSAGFLKESRSRSPSYVKATLQRFVSDGIMLEGYGFENAFFREWMRS